MSKKYNYKDHFEMLVLRHDHLKMCTKKDESLLINYNDVIKSTAGALFRKNKFTYSKVSYDYDDILHLTKLYAWIFINKYSLIHTSKHQQTFNESYRDHPKLHDPAFRLQKDKTGMVTFLINQLNQLSMVCKRKTKNINLYSVKQYYYAKTPESLPVSNPEVIVGNHNEMGYNKITHKEYKQAKQRCQSSIVTDEANNELLCVYKVSNALDYHDGRLLMNNMNKMSETPLTILNNLESRIRLENKIDKFKDLEGEEKARILRKFISKNKGNPEYKKELNTAKKMLKQCESSNSINSSC